MRPRRKALRRGPASAAVKPRIPGQGTLLPSINGPKIGPFLRAGFHSFSDFRLESLIDEPSSSGGGEGYVLKASFNGESYAIKIFNFFDIEDGKFRFSDGMLARIDSDKHLAETIDPFYAECRAYGRINEIYKRLHPGQQPHDLKSEHLLAVPCYGYILLTQSHEKALASQFPSIGFKRDPEQHGRIPVRALVKRYVPEPSFALETRSVKRMMQDLKTLHDHGLYPIDIRVENYCAGLLVDFGMALTTPSCVLDAVPEVVANRERGRGQGAFDRMIREEGIKTRVRAWNGMRWKSRTRAGRKMVAEGELLMLDYGRGKGGHVIAVEG